MNIIQTEKLSKKFGKTPAVDGVSVNVRAGEIYGFLGLNGAGKTTTIRLLLGLIKPDSGTFALFGQTVKPASSIWNEVGYLVEAPAAYPELSVQENLQVFHRLRGLEDPRLIDQIIEKLRLGAHRNKPARHLSQGNKQRLSLAKALMHRPRLLILDEPINGLDPSGIVEIRNLLKYLVNQHNSTIFLSSHNLAEIARLATRIGIIHEGKLVKEINAGDLEVQTNKKLLINTVDNFKALQIFKNRGLNATVNGNDLIEIPDLSAIQHPEEIATLLVTSQIPPKLLTIFEEDLEAYFLRIIMKEKTEC